MRLAFFDETGRAGDTEFVGMAACVALWPAWKEFDARWGAALKKNGAPYLHMVDFAHSHGPYKGWSEAQRRGLMADCLAAIKDLEIIVFSAVMKSADFEALPDKDKEGLEDPYLCVFQECLHGVALTGHMDFPGDKVGVIYSLQDEFKERFEQMHTQWKAWSVDGHKLGTLTFRDMRESPGLQLADLVAYESLHYYHLRAHRPELPPRFPFKAVIDHQLALKAGAFRYIPQWVLGPKARGVWPVVQEALWSDVEANMDLILQLAPAPALDPERVRRLVVLRDAGALEKLRAGALRGK